jgi:hypothetical protein
MSSVKIRMSDFKPMRSSIFIPTRVFTEVETYIYDELPIVLQFLEKYSDTFIGINTSSSIELNKLFHLLNKMYKECNCIYKKCNNKTIEKRFNLYKIMLKRIFSILYECERLSLINNIELDLDENEVYLPIDLLNFKYVMFISKNMRNKEWNTQILNEEIKHLYDMPKMGKKKRVFIKGNVTKKSVDKCKISFIIENRLKKIQKMLQELIDCTEKNLSVDEINNMILIELKLIQLYHN